MRDFFSRPIEDVALKNGYIGELVEISYKPLDNETD